MEHGEKIIDGIIVKYVCQPCPECKAKLEASEEMAKALIRAKDHLIMSEGLFLVDGRVGQSVDWKEALEEARAALSTWEKAGKGKNNE